MRKDCLRCRGAIRDPEEIGSDLWASAQSVGANWLQSDWFGSFYLTDTPWLYHHGLGWMFTIGTSDSDLWIWNDDLGWVWTARATFPIFIPIGKANGTTGTEAPMSYGCSTGTRMPSG